MIGAKDCCNSFVWTKPPPNSRNSMERKNDSININFESKVDDENIVVVVADDPNTNTLHDNDEYDIINTDD